MTTTSKTFTIGDSIKKEQPNIQYGWKCPSCGAIMAPWQNSCINCIGTHEPYCGPSITWHSTGDPIPWWDQVTCNATSKSGDTITSAWNGANTTSVDNSLKSAMKSNGINI